MTAAEDGHSGAWPGWQRAVVAGGAVAAGFAAIVLGYVYFDLILLLLPWKRLAARAPAWLLRTGAKRVLHETGRTAAVAILVKPSWRRRVQEIAVRMRTRARAGRRLATMRWRRLPTRGRVLVASVPVGILVVLLFIVGTAWTLVLPLVGIPRSVRRGLRALASRFLLRTGLSTAFSRILHWIVRPVRHLLERLRFRALFHMVRVRRRVHGAAAALAPDPACEHGDDQAHRAGDEPAPSTISIRQGDAP